MKRNRKRMWRSAVSFALVLLLVLSSVSTAFAGVKETAPNEEINYVSLGDSMSNGYGLDGYELNSGVETYGTVAYANQFADWLVSEGYSEKVDHAQLAMSGIRAEDLHWLLELDYNDQESIDLIQELIDGDWNEEKWNAKFSTGDYWTLEEICNHSRLNATYSAIVGESVFDGNKTIEFDSKLDSEFEYPTTHKSEDGISRSERVAVVAKYFQEHVAEADVASLAVGNGNFGVFSFGRIMEAVGFGATNEEQAAASAAKAMVYNVESAIRECEPEMQEEILNLKAELYATVEEKIGQPIEDNPTLEALANTIVYTGLSFVLNYAGSVEAILQLNPDAEIILVALMNTMGTNSEEVEGITLGDVMEAIITPLNAFIAGLPTYMQATQNSVYKDAKFYYAEADYVEVIVDTYDNLKEDPIVRDRFFKSIVKEGEDLGMVWKLLGSTVTADFTLDDVEAYEKLTDEEKLAYAAIYSKKAMSISMYLAFEDAIVAGKDTPVTIDSIMGLSSIFAEGSDPFGAIMTDFGEKAVIRGESEALNAIATFIADNSGDMLTAEQAKSVVLENASDDVVYGILAKTASDLASNEFGISIDLTANQVETLCTGNESEQNALIYALVASLSGDTLDPESVKGLAEGSLTVYQIVAAGSGGALNAGQVEAMYGAPGYEAITENVDKLNEVIDYVNTFKGYIPTLKDGANTIKGVPGTANTLYMLLVMPEVLSESVAESELSGLLALFARCIIGNGIGSHPSAKGHDALADAVIKAYDEGYTAQDKTIENIIYIVSEYYDEAYAYAYKYADENGYIDATIEGIDAVIAELEKLDPEKLDKLSAELRAELANDIENAIETAEALKDLIEEADVLDQATLDAAIELLNKLGQNVTDIRETLTQAGIDAGNQLWKAYEYLKPIVIEQLKTAVEKGTEWLMQKAQEAYDAFIEALPEIDAALYQWFYDNPDVVLGFFYEYGDEMGKFIEENYEIIGAVIGYIGYTYGDDVLQAILDDPEGALKDFVAWYEKYGERTWKMIDRYMEESGLKDLIKEKADEIIQGAITGATDLVEKYGEEVLKEVYAYLEDNGYRDILNAAIEDFEAAMEAIEANYEASIGFEYELQKDNYYVALGDSTAYPVEYKKNEVVPYGDRLAKELGLANSKYKNLSEENMTAEEVLAVIAENKEDIAKSDLITVGFGNGAIIEFVLNQITSDPVELDWSKFAGQAGAAEVEKALAKIEEKLLESMDQKTADMMMVALESYAYKYAELAVAYPQIIDAIHEINPETQVVIVGMYNPLSGVEFAMDGMEPVAIGEYLDYIIKASNAYYFGLALLNENTVYVDAPAVENNVAEGEMGLRQIMNLLLNPTALYPTDNGHEYIKEQILGVMEVTNGMWGDVNRDGKVSPIDASFILQYYTKQITENDLDLKVSDVSGDGKTSPIDASFILQYYTKQIDKFPAEKL